MKWLLVPEQSTQALAPISRWHHTIAAWVMGWWGYTHCSFSGAVQLHGSYLKLYKLGSGPMSTVEFYQRRTACACSGNGDCCGPIGLCFLHKGKRVLAQSGRQGSRVRVFCSPLCCHPGLPYSTGNWPLPFCTPSLSFRGSSLFFLVLLCVCVSGGWGWTPGTSSQLSCSRIQYSLLGSIIKRCFSQSW